MEYGRLSVGLACGRPCSLHVLYLECTVREPILLYGCLASRHTLHGTFIDNRIPTHYGAEIRKNVIFHIMYGLRSAALLPPLLRPHSYLSI